MNPNIHKVYLAGPMRGYPLFNFPAFHDAAALLRADGYEVWSPAENDVEIFDPNNGTPKPMSHYMERDLPAICRADAVAVLPGWEKSEGARLEVDVAWRLGKTVFHAINRSLVIQQIEFGGVERRVTDSKTGGQKGQKIERFDLIPIEPLIELATLYGKGAIKYSDDNWRKGYSWLLSVGAMLRHLSLFLLGESKDTETGCHHLASVAWHCFTLQWFELHKQGTDDRKDKRP